ncbi:2-dehydro-3-deoxyphosphooctonate aldolase [Flavobacterium sp. NG2]|uniref:2-dehydro-3-deoxyphosphooctonate aldolase n=1 Tax=Flavobacterium sp. NG2 TaxID=3097547 RepID=UPI002A7F2C9F|nr:2-dehydro-3-deoxyphosphooctonate aldolase [Flavobacterium sp. NG2]WPR70935.1 2-dehydro-3-deoxyphosphooctonate aldolase [Flavobacterium sp. NG2]
MKKIMASIAVITISCSSKKTITTEDKGTGDTRTKTVELIDHSTYLLTEQSDDKTYGYNQSNPIKVGGVKTQEGPLNERRFLNALFGPSDKKMTYFRAGSCCPFKTPNGFINNSGMLDRYRLTEIGTKDTIDIYINMYDTGDLKIPFGLKAKEKE